MSLCVQKNLTCTPCRPSSSRLHYVGSYLYCLLLCPHTTGLIPWNLIERKLNSKTLPTLSSLPAPMLSSAEPHLGVLLLCRSKQEQLVDIQLCVCPRGKHFQSWWIQASSEYPCMYLNRMNSIFGDCKVSFDCQGQWNCQWKGGFMQCDEFPNNVNESWARKK